MQISSLLSKACRKDCSIANRNAGWLQEQMSPCFFQAMSRTPEAVATLVREMSTLQHNRRLILSDTEKSLILACVDEPGSLFDSLKQLDAGAISCAMFSHSYSSMPGMDQELEVQGFEFERKSNAIFKGQDSQNPVPRALKRKIFSEIANIDPQLKRHIADKLLHVLWLNSEDQIRFSSPQQTAWLIWLFARSNASGGLYLDVSLAEHNGIMETRVMFAVGNPPQDDFLLQIAEVFNRLDIGIRRAYCITITNGIHPYFLGIFFVRRRDGEELGPDTQMARQMKEELCNTQILDNSCKTYREWVTEGIMQGDDAALVNAFITFCHTNLAHNQPDRFGLEDVQSAFHSHPEIAIQFLRLFKARFDPAIQERESVYIPLLNQTTELVRDYNTGHRWLDLIRQTIYRCSLLLITNTLKTNFFVTEKQALAFRLDPSYLRELGTAFTADLPEKLPFRVTFFFSRFGHGYHIGFSDIARGGWRTVIALNQDDAITAANTLFREVYVLAHTQHMKNKDIYEGGSKMVLVMDHSGLEDKGQDEKNNLLYKLQYCVINAFLDILITCNGKVRDPRIVDYYGDDEPIEIGPDENMHDAMIEAIAALSSKRGYMLGVGIMSSKRFGINHKEYGVTSTGVMTFAEVVMADQGIDIRKDRFSIKLTGGPGGDVAGNCLRILLDNCPEVGVVLVLDGTAAAFDPHGLDREELRRITLIHDLDAFVPDRLSPGGMMIFRTGSRLEGLRELHRRVERLADGSLHESWIAPDDFYREYSGLVFQVQADIFIPAGGRPETIDNQNWQDFLKPDGTPTAKVIVEGANSFITPEARLNLQRAGVILMRDASANKCGVISSSYEIIANLLMTEKEFLSHKDTYIENVLDILKKRAGDEAHMILRRHRESGGVQTYTEISDMISQNINSYYHRLFQFFTDNPQLCLKAPFKAALLRHLPSILQREPHFRMRICKLPSKYQAAILAAEIGASLVYTGDRDKDFEEMVKRHLARIARH